MKYQDGKEPKVGDKIQTKDSEGKPLTGVVVRLIPDAPKLNLEITPDNGIASVVSATAEDCSLAG